MTKVASMAALGLLAGFAFGVLWGQGTRKAAPSQTQTSFDNGVVTVKVNAYGALAQGLASALGR